MITKPVALVIAACLFATATATACFVPDSSVARDGRNGRDGANGKDGDVGGSDSSGVDGRNEPGASSNDDDPPILPAKPGSGSKRMVGYFAGWSVYARNYHIADVPASKLTHLNFGFANISKDGECILGDKYADTEKPYPGDNANDPLSLKGSFHQMQLLKQRQPGLKTLIAIGGWTWSENFSTNVASEAGRKKLANSCVAFAKRYGFDGVDVDWEFPVSGGLLPGRPEDKPNYTLFLSELRKSLDAAGGGLLTIAGPGAARVIANLELEKIAPLVDWINVMAYDLHGQWEKTTNFNAALYSRPGDTVSVDSGVKAYLIGKVPADKLVVGIPLYGRGYALVASGAKGDGLDQAFTGMPKGSWEDGVFDYKDLKTSYVGKMTRRWDDVAKVPWLFDPTTKVFISYEDSESIALKGKYIYDHGLGGGMFWELSGEDSSGAMLETLRAKL